MSFEITEQPKLTDDESAVLLDHFQMSMAELVATVAPHIHPSVIANCLHSGCAEILRRHFPAEQVSEALMAAAAQVLEQNGKEIH